MKKYFSILLLLIAIAMVATSCKKDDKEEAGTNSDLVGTWVAAGYDEKDGGEWVEQFEFKSGGECVYTWTYDGDTDREKFGWSATKSTITLTDGKDSETYDYTISSNGKALNWEWDDEVTYYKR